MLVNSQNPLNHHGETVVNGLETVGNRSAKADAGGQEGCLQSFYGAEKKRLVECSCS
jgi:hypothetical protein